MTMGAMMTRRGKPQTEILGAPKARADGPTPEQLRSGDFARRFTMHVETATETMTHVSRHDPVERWRARGMLSDHQDAAIRLCQRIWHLIGIEQNVTANWGEARGGSGDVEYRVQTKLEAKDDLKRIEGYFTGLILPRWWVFENCCRHGMPAGIAGGDDRNGAHTAYITVCWIADEIAMRERL